MSHMVIYRSLDGQPVYQQAEGLEEAVRHVESLRNAGQGDDARIFRMHEVPIAVKTYYRVEVSEDSAAPSPAPAPAAVSVAPVAAQASSAPTPAPEPPAVPDASAAPAAMKPEPATAGTSPNGGRFGLFGKG